MQIFQPAFWSSFILGVFTLAAYAQEPESFKPVAVNALPGSLIGTVSLDRLSSGNVPIQVYSSSAGNTGAELALVSPYIAIATVEFQRLHNQYCGENPKAFPNLIPFTVETGSEDVFRAVTDQIPAHTQTQVGIYPYVSVELIDSRRDITIWRDPIRPGLVPYKEAPLARGSAFLLNEVSCDDLYRYAFGSNELEARAVVPTSIESSSVSRFTYATFRDRVFNADFYQQAGRDGGLQTNATTTVTGRANSSGLLGAVFGGSSSGTTRTEVETSETDTRKRWIDRNAMRKIVSTLSVDIRGSNFCVEGAPNCSSEAIENAIAQSLDRFLSYELIPILTKEQAEAFDGAYFEITDPATVERSRETSMNPSFSNSASLAVDCEALKQAAMTAGGVPPTPSTTPATSNLQGGWPEPKPTNTTGGGANPPTNPVTRPSNTSPSDCGFSETTSVMDKNSVVWKYNGTEWVPTDIELAFIDENQFANILRQQIVNVVSSGTATFVSVGIPLLRTDDASLSEFETLRGNLEALLGRLETPQCREERGDFVPRRESCNEHSNFINKAGCGPGEYMQSVDIIHANEQPSQPKWQCQFRITCCRF